jgi:hypothetical protein
MPAEPQQEEVNNLMRGHLGRFVPPAVKAELERRGLRVPDYEEQDT